jgi:hypothetical protein
MDDQQKQNLSFHAAMPVPVMTKEPAADSAPAAEAAPSAAAEGTAPDEAMLVPARTKKQEDEAMADAGENKAKIVLRALKSIEENLANVIKLLEEDGATALPAVATALAAAPRLKPVSAAPIAAENGRVVEGVFNGQHMVGADGKIYSVPPNYASKSKLVEGDLLKLTISNTGSFIYKQIGPIERRRIVGQLGYDHTTGEYFVTADDKRWSVIKASVTYFKGEAGDEAVLLVPMDAPSRWGAVENIIRRTPV